MQQEADELEGVGESRPQSDSSKQVLAAIEQGTQRDDQERVDKRDHQGQEKTSLKESGTETPTGHLI